MCVQSQLFDVYDPFLPMRWKVAIMIQGFFDDSGKEGDPSNRIVCAAGYAGLPGVWNGFQEIWRHFLFKHDMKWLHMKDFMNDKSSEYSYLGLDWPQKQIVLADFISAIKMHSLVGFGVSVDTEAWKRLPPAFIKANGTAQEFCFMRILRMLVERVKRSSPEDAISLTFDCDINYTPVRFQKYLRAREKIEDARKHLAAFMVAEPKIYAPLQAADLLAWETRKDLLRQIDGNSTRPELQHMLSIIPGFFPDYQSELWTEHNLEANYGPLLPPIKDV